MLKIISYFCILILFSLTAAAEKANANDLDGFIEKMYKSHGFNKKELKNILIKQKPNKKVLEAFDRPSTSLPWYKFKKIFVTNTRTKKGVDFWKKNKNILMRARREFGVPEEIIVSIIGVETIYGERTGSFNILESLYTLGFYGKRRKVFFKNELENFLILVSKNKLDYSKLNGSFAGAMGIPQFMPSSYLNYAIDFDEDGKIDLWNSLDDVIGSVANYLSKHNWEKEIYITEKITLNEKNLSENIKKGYKPRYKISNLRTIGVKIDKRFSGNLKVGIFKLEEASGLQYWLSFNNFYVITRYNRSTNYAMAVNQLAKKIKNSYFN